MLAALTGSSQPFGNFDCRIAFIVEATLAHAWGDGSTHDHLVTFIALYQDSTDGLCNQGKVVVEFCHLLYRLQQSEMFLASRKESRELRNSISMLHMLTLSTHLCILSR